MTGNSLKVPAAVCVVCGGAFAGGLLAQNAAWDKGLASGALVAVPGLVSATIVYLARRARTRTPNQALQQTGGA